VLEQDTILSDPMTDPAVDVQRSLDYLTSLA
jgi:hypothetical protein